MKRASLPGVTLARGPADWQILQRRLDGRCDIPLAGTWRLPEGDARTARVEVRVADPRTQRAVSGALDWHEADASPVHTWTHVLKNVPAGGPYRIETRLRAAGDDWRLAGDKIHWVGVGDLWAIAGQSNAVGYGHGPVEDPPEDGVHLFRPSHVWTRADHPIFDSTGTRHPAHFDTGWVDHSPWLAFARRLRGELGIPIGLIPAALGGSPLSAWDPGAASPFLYRNLLALIRAASSYRNFAAFDMADGGPVLLPPPGVDYGVLAGMVWHQGCFDTGAEELARSYGARFARFVEGLRRDLASPELPVVTCQLNRVIGVADPRQSAWWGVVREAQRAASHDMPRVAVVPTLDCDLSDGIHLGPSGNLRVGDRCAQAALGMAYGLDVAWQSPDLASAAFEPGQRDRIRLEFSGVSGWLWSCAGEIGQFAAGDAAGRAAVRKAELIGPAAARLTLVRELGDAPKVWNCATHDPKVCLLDRDQRPILAFAEAAVSDARPE